MSLELWMLIAAAVPLLTAALTPRRWLLPAMALAALTPFVALAVILCLEAISGSQPDVPALFVTSLIFGSVLILVPWAVLYVGFGGLGLLLRRVTRPAGSRDGRERPAPAVPLGEPAPAVAEVVAGAAGTVELAQAPVGGADLAPFDPGSEYQSRLVSPDGTIHVELELREWSNTHWVRSPRIVDLSSGQTILDLWDTDWDAAVTFPQPRQVHLFLRRYRSGNALAVDLDLAAGDYRIVMEPGHDGDRPAEPLAGLAAGLEAASRRSASAPGAVRRPPIRTRPFGAWKVALVILIAAGLLAWVASQFTIREAQVKEETLTPMPKPLVLPDPVAAP